MEGAHTGSLLWSMPVKVKWKICIDHYSMRLTKDSCLFLIRSPCYDNPVKTKRD